MKRIFILMVFYCVAVLSLTGCGSQEMQQPSSPQADGAEKTAFLGRGSLMGKAAASNAKALIVYYSWSGHTRQIANEIQKQTGADVFEIIPEKPYTKDYDTLVELAKEEKKNNIHPAITGKIDHFEAYDVVFIGFPNWWSDLPMVLYTFFDQYDLSGKKVVPFCTSGGGGFGGSLKAMQALEPNADFLEGFHMNGSQVGNSQSAVNEWLNRLDILK